MRKTLLLSAAVLASTLAASPQINTQAPEGYLVRSERMLSDGNFRGCIDQLSTLDLTQLSRADREQAAWLRCRAAYEGGYTDATALLCSFTEQYAASSHRVEALLMLANSLVETSPAEAYSIYKGIAPSALDSSLAADLKYHTAYAQMKLGDYDAADRGFASLTANRKFGSLSKFFRGYLAYVRHDYKAAKSLLEAADRSQSPGSSADYYLAQIYYVEGDYARALKYAKAMLQNPVGEAGFNAEAERIAGESLFAQGRTDQAIPHLSRYIDEVEVPEKSALYILGTYEYDNGNYARAIELLEPVTTSESAMGQSAYLFVGEALMQQGNKDAALMAFDNALRMDFDPKVQEAAYYNYAVAKFGGASLPFGSSVATFEEFLRRYPNGRYAPQVQEYLVAGYLTDKNYETALESINRMARPTDKVLAAKQQVLYALGARSLSVGNAAQARKYLTEGTKLAKYSSEIAYRTQHSLGEACFALGDYDASVKALQAYLSAAPNRDINRPLALYDLGYAQLAKKQYSQAAGNFRSVTSAPGNLPEEAITDALNRLGDAYYYLEDFDKANASYAQAYDRMPEAGDYPLFQQGVIQGYRRDYVGKIATLGDLLDNFPTSSLVPDALLEITEGYLRLGRNDEAIDTYRRLVADHAGTEQGRRGYLQLAMTLLNTGDRAGAIDAYRQVIRRYPTSDEARVAIEEAQRLAAEDGNLGEFRNFLASVDNAPQMDVADADRLTFEAAEQTYMNSQATNRLQRYLDEYPDGAYRAQTYGYLMEAAVNDENSESAQAYASAIIDRYPDTRLAENALAVKAEAEHSLGQGYEAMRTYTLLESRASDPATLNTARVGIMRVARDLADYQRVISAADALLASSTIGSEDRNEAIFSRAMAKSLTGNVKAARSEWQQIASNTDDLYGAKSAYYLAESYYNAKDYSTAKRHAEALIDASTPHAYWLARTFILLSDIFAAQGKNFEAREYLRSLKENYPGTESDIFQMIDSRLNKLK